MATTTTSFRKTTLSHAQKTVLAMSRAQYLDAIRASRPADKLYVGVCIFRMDTHSSRPSVLLLRRSRTTASGSESSSSSSAATSATTVTTAASPVFRRETRRNRQLGDNRERGIRGGAGNGSGNRNANGNGIGSGVWELPGGKVRDSDFCISAAVARRVVEQTGLRVVRVLGALQDVRHVSEVRILDWDDDGMGIFTSERRGSVDGESNDSSTDLSMSILDGATLTSGTGTDSPSGSSNGGFGGRSLRRSASRREPIHNPQLVLRRDCLQLNYAVLVQSHEDLGIRSRDHDELVWASFSRAEALPMHEELRTVVHQGLAFAGEYLF
ncbi:uncharacterized protein GGS22DRAFT_157749 [Annulohypoxylon maeteangense]|uniref:uncharacterized protein n=1 Tax=Annulohypoxylon maeteangense TaxID=1927788 RepID=UPI0020076100|nr:uncharacterized protein GGS22DRAFT_157749 [Annulohypoxylon maeteangense]KAI0887649.1 hypothetical protein GGS22DRAFT_157749 [Annulohypoxylon maeteangense]